MWPFKKKDTESKYDMTKEAIDELKSFRGIGEKFNYMGIRMIVEDHYAVMFNPYMVFPRISAAYMDNHGVLRYAEFLRKELPALRAENPNKTQENIPPTVEFGKNG